MGEPQTPHLYDFTIWGRVPKPQNKLFLCLETPGHRNKSSKTLEHCLKNYFYKSEKWKSQTLTISERTGAEQIHLGNLGCGINIFQKT